jgi:hypothetical protein
MQLVAASDDRHDNHHPDYDPIHTNTIGAYTIGGDSRLPLSDRYSLDNSKYPQQLRLAMVSCWLRNLY